MHNIHFARLREGYAERNNIGLPTAGIQPKTLSYLGFNNSLLDFQEILAPLDVALLHQLPPRHRRQLLDSAPCGYGQCCQSGKCMNVAWQNPTARACITCHDAGGLRGPRSVEHHVSRGGELPGLSWTRRIVESPPFTTITAPLRPSIRTDRNRPRTSHPQSSGKEELHGP